MRALNSMLCSRIWRYLVGLPNRDNYKWNMRYLLALSVLVLLLLMVWLLEILLERPPPYFAITSMHHTRHLQGLDMPVTTNRYVLRWSSMVLRSVYNLKFTQDQADLDKFKIYFTSKGWNALSAARQSAGVIQN